MTNNLPKSNAQRDSKRILVVDDEPRMIGFIRMNLELEGHHVIEAHNGMEALEAIRTQLPDVVLLDVMMPELDGFETLRMLREFSTVPVIMLTAKGDENDKVYGLELGLTITSQNPLARESYPAALKPYYAGQICPHPPPTMLYSRLMIA
nr:response regulator [Phototrophicus methaneseepsis]